jgi:branched-chain amino acid transport system substrate-binding protein
MKKTIEILGIIIGILILTTLSLNLTGLNVLDNNLEKDEIKIGAIFLLSGEGASWGEHSKNAIELAVKEVNEKGGIEGKKIKVIYQDSQANPEKTILAYNKLKEVDDVKAIIGPNYQASTVAISNLANKDKFPVISPSYAPKENREDLKNPLMVWLDPVVESKEMANYVYNKGHRNIGIIGTHDSWEKTVSNAFREEFKKLGGTVSYYELLQKNDKEVSSVITKLKNKQVDSVFIGSYYQFYNTTKKLKEVDFKGEIYSIEIDDYLAEKTKQFSDGIEFISSDRYKERFREKYETEYGIKANIPAGQAYDSANILIDILKETQKSAEILERLKALKEYQGVSGKIEFLENGRTIMPTAVYKIENGEVKKI